MSHPPLPYTVGRGKYTPGVEVHDANGRQVFPIAHPQDNGVTDADTAEFIVRACNQIDRTLHLLALAFDYVQGEFTNPALAEEIEAHLKEAGYGEA